MIHLKRLGVAMALTMALTASLVAAGASATTFEKNGVIQNNSLHITASAKSGSSLVTKDTNNFTLDTCKSVEVTFDTSSPYTGATVTGIITHTTWSGCTEKTVVIKPGTIHFKAIGGTRATITWSKSETTVESTIFGASCIAQTGEGTTVGTFNGVSSGEATATINGVIPMGLCGDVTMTGNYNFTSPTGLGIDL